MFNTVSSEWFPSEIQEYIGDFSVGSEVYWKGEYNKTLKLLEKRSDDSINLYCGTCGEYGACIFKDLNFYCDRCVDLDTYDHLKIEY